MYDKWGNSEPQCPLYYYKMDSAFPEIDKTKHINTRTVTTLLKTSFLVKQYTALGKNHLQLTMHLY